MLRRFSEMKPSRGTRIPDDVRAFVTNRDRLCVGFVLGMPGECAGSFELDHVRASGGLGMCSAHHRYRTEHGREWRPKLIEYLEGRAA